MSGAGACYDVAVVGSGIIGLGAALAAVRRGLRVVVIERGSEPTGATIRNFGHLCITPQYGAARRYGLASRALWLELERDAGVWVRESGTLVAARANDEFDVLDELASTTAGAPGASGRPQVELLTIAEVESRVPVAPGSVVGGALLPMDLQADPRQAVGAIASHLGRLGVEFRWRTSVGSIQDRVVRTSRGPVEAERIVVAVNHDIDLLYPDVAERAGIMRCGLDMLRVSANLRSPLEAPLLTGWSLVRYSAFSATAAAHRLRERLHAERPDLAALDLNQMYTQLPDGTLIVGDTHSRGTTITPFQSEAAADALITEARLLFGIDAPRVLERWQGIYASGPDDFLDVEIEPGVHLVAATTGIGMTTGLGLAEHVVGRFAEGPGNEHASIRTHIFQEETT